jgi:streptogramin lyase
MGDQVVSDQPLTEFSIPTAKRHPDAIVLGPDGNLWFTTSVSGSSGVIGRISPADGTVTELAVTMDVDGAKAITAGPDGNLWIAETPTGAIGRITPSGTVTEFRLPGVRMGSLTVGSWPCGITAGPDGNLWFTEQQGDAIGRITP